MRPLISALLFSLLLSACDSQGAIEDFEAEAALSPSGYTETDDQGTVGTEDSDDWRSSPLFVGKVRVDPAWPNPLTSGIITVPVSVLEFDAVPGGLVLRARDASGRLRLIDELPEASTPGAFVFQFAPAILARTGLIRLFVLDRLGSLVSYGDILVE